MAFENEVDLPIDVRESPSITSLLLRLWTLVPLERWRRKHLERSAMTDQVLEVSAIK